MPGRSTAFDVVVDEDARAELERIPVFHRRALIRALRELEHQARTETRNRKPLAAPLELLPDATTWEVRVGDFRAFYRVDDRAVRVLRVRLKTGTTEDSL